jgi:Cu(I)/Ag(I) efflux system membrane protein CusA/SilA
LLKQKLVLPPGFTYKWSGEYEFELRAKDRLQLILPIVFFVIFLLLYMVFHSVTEAAVLIFPTIYALTGGLILQRLLGYNFSVAVTRSFRGARTRRRAISPAGSRRNSVIPDSDPSEPTKQ